MVFLGRYRETTDLFISHFKKMKKHMQDPSSKDRVRENGLNKFGHWIEEEIPRYGI